MDSKIYGFLKYPSLFGRTESHAQAAQAMLQVLKYPALGDRLKRLTRGNRLLLALLLKYRDNDSCSCTELHELVRGQGTVMKAVCGDSEGDRVEHIVKSRVQTLAMQELLIEVTVETAEHR